ncbi:MAG: hypothetical protein COS42_07975 [Flavobacteriales bacterium CG03_land_8_20_14_0_80_35_15]|nr:MAG: hypothetical protein COS42_07975 [Flavobacteriales bacterium CG03_land_8_20_14_0_80_35_15]PIX07937.1 MAG: hypothetical protein COZ76_00785 [Flavobacteriales bacterium CG_4_8_14_3_um_filter_35_10]
MPKNYAFWLLLVCTLLFVSNLDVIYINIMEARNFISAREMLSNGNWLHTTLNLEPRYEKPPLPTWLTALSMYFFGTTNLYGLRLPAIISAIIMIFASFKLVNALVKDAFHALVSSLILATSFYIIYSGREAQWDIFAHSFMLLSILYTYKTLKKNKPQYQNALLAGFFMGLSLLSKGPVSLYALFLPFIFAYALSFHFKGFFKQLRPAFFALILAIIIGSWWAIYIYLTDVQAVKTIATKETVAWSNRNVRAWYYYWSFFTQSGLWSFFALIGLVYPFIKSRVINLRAYRFSMIWTMSAVILLSLIPEKKSRYLLPVLIPLALNTSFYVHYLIVKAKSLPKLDKFMATFGFGLLALVCFAIPLVGFLKYPFLVQKYPINYGFFSIVLVAIGIYIIKTLWQTDYKQSFYASIALMCSVMILGLPLLKGFYNNPNFKSIHQLKQWSELQAIPVFVKGYIAPELLWEYGEPIETIEDINEINSLSQFGLITQDSLPSAYKNAYQVILNQHYDLNYMRSNSGKENKRLKTEFYLLEKKQDTVRY